MVALTFACVSALVVAGARYLRPMDLVTVPVPDVVGLPRAEAEAALHRAGLTPSRRTVESSNDTLWDRVLQQSPVAGRRAARGQKVAILLSVREGTRPTAEEVGPLVSYEEEEEAEAAPTPRARPAAEPAGLPFSIGVPRVTGKSEGSARRALRAVGLGLKIAKRRFSRTVPRGRVMRQYPRPGEAPPADENVRVVVSRGRATHVSDAARPTHRRSR